MVTLYIKITVVIINLLVLRCANAGGGILGLRSDNARGGIRYTYTYHGYRKNKLDILSINRNYSVYKHLSSKYPPQKDEVNCSFSISFEGQVEIDICHNEDYEHYLLCTNVVGSWYITENEELYVECRSMEDIIERKETTIQCTVRRIRMDEYYGKQQNVTIGWIQGDNATTQTFNLAERSKNFTQIFKGFHSGDGIFFYCFSIQYLSRNKWYLYYNCYTFRLTVYPEIKIEIQRLYESPEFPDNRYCFKCYVGLPTDEKSYKWNLNGEEMTNLDQHKKDERCFSQSTLQAGKNSVECTVILKTTGEKRSGRMEFSQVKTTPKQNNQNIALITMAVTTTIFGFIILILLYKLKKKHGKHPQQAVHYQRNTAASVQERSDIPQNRADEQAYQRNTAASVQERSDIPQNRADEQAYYSTIKDNAENVYVITESDMMTETNKYTKEEIHKMDDPEIPHYFVLESQ